jgi:heptosyltransferase I
MALSLESPPESVCILRLSAIGDTCHALAVVRTLQVVWPNTRLTWVIGKTESQLLGDVPGVEFVVFDKSRGWSAHGDLRHALRGRKFDVLLAMHASLRANVASRMISARRRIGFDRKRAKDYQWLFTREQIPARPRQHALDAMFEFVEYLGIDSRELRWDIPLSEADHAFAAEHSRGEEPLLVISPCSSQRARNFRNWSAENYAAVCDHFAQRWGGRVILTGGPTELERTYGADIARHATGDVLDLIGKTSLKELLAILDRASVLVCPDSGPAHMATAVNTPVVGLYATSNPDRTGPFLSREYVVNHYPDAVRAEFKKSVDELPWGGRVRNPAAMDRITQEEVVQMLDRVLTESVRA